MNKTRFLVASIAVLLISQLSLAAEVSAPKASTEKTTATDSAIVPE